MVNSVVVVGRLTRDCSEVHVKESVVVNFSLASNDFVDGEKRTTFFEVVLWGNSFRNFVGYLKKGTVVMVSGKLYVKQWTSAAGRQRVDLKMVAKDISFVPGAGKDGILTKEDVAKDKDVNMASPKKRRNK